MKVGDLVVLSSAGEKISANWRQRGEMGIILSVRHTAEDPYQVSWFRCSSAHTTFLTYWFKRYEIKKLRVKK